MGIEPFLVGTAVHLVQAQRLVRRICSGCREDVTQSVPERSLLAAGFGRDELDGLRLQRGRGCAACAGSGYKGRVGLYETLEMSERVRDLVMMGATPIEVRKAALAEGMLTLRMSGLEKIRRGITTLEEVLRETVR
jgi:type IV pilus assembly protein PilB